MDRNSVIADPLFVDFENGDYSLKEGSGARSLGFVDIPIIDAPVANCGSDEGKIPCREKFYNELEVDPRGRDGGAGDELEATIVVCVCIFGLLVMFLGIKRVVKRRMNLELLGEGEEGLTFSNSVKESLMDFTNIEANIEANIEDEDDKFDSE